jgi:ABC-2 type transport system permease protein
VTPDAQWADAQLRAGQIDAVAVVPSRVRDTLASGQQVHIPIYINAISPMRRDYVDFVTSTIVRDINKDLSRQAMLQALSQAQVTSVSPDVIVEPVVTTTENVARFKPTYVGFYAPAVLALLIQHVAVTFAALSLVRDRLQGTNELFRVSPLGPGQALFGKFLSYLLLTLAVALILALLLVFGLGVPRYGDPWQFIGLIVLEICASLGWGFFISAISPRESQAVQWSMILLLASVFFSGFFLDLAGLIPALQVISYSLPVTYAITGLQEVMLAARPVQPSYFLALGGITLILMLLAWVIYRRQFRLA